MIDPTQITDFEADDSKLQELILFWVCAAGKNGVISAKALESLLSSNRKHKDQMPFEIISMIEDLPKQLKIHGIGCYNNKAKTFHALLESNLNLRTCSVDDLEKIPGIGPKTARCFLIHSRKNQSYAGLDTHILKFLRDQGHKVPKSTPIGKKYKECEQLFLQYAKESGKTVAEFDLEIWNHYRSFGK